MVEGIAFASVPVSKKRVGAYLLPLHNLYKSFQDEFCSRDSEVIGVDVYWKCDARVDAVFQWGVLNENGVQFGFDSAFCNGKTSMYLGAMLAGKSCQAQP